jgi:hypothetical protein
MIAYLYAWNEGDYAGWTADWSDEMLALSDETSWQEARTQALPLTGKFETIGELTSEEFSNGFTKWTAICDFEQVQIVFAIVLPNAGGNVQGLYMDPYVPESGSPAPSAPASASASAPASAAASAAAYRTPVYP